MVSIPFVIAEPFSLSAEVQKSQLITESWYHGGISRPVAEDLLRGDGDFLVRESQGTPGQYVLSGMQKTSPKHLLLIDPQGIVRRLCCVPCTFSSSFIAIPGEDQGPCV